MSKHVAKYMHEDGKKLDNPIYWCGRASSQFDWYFMDAQHVALSDGYIVPCKSCVKAIIKELQKNL